MALVMSHSSMGPPTHDQCDDDPLIDGSLRSWRMSLSCLGSPSCDPMMVGCMFWRHRLRMIRRLLHSFGDPRSRSPCRKLKVQTRMIAVLIPDSEKMLLCCFSRKRLRCMKASIAVEKISAEDWWLVRNGKREAYGRGPRHQRVAL